MLFYFRFHNYCRRNASVVYTVVVCLCVSKRLNLQSRKQCHTIVWRLEFSAAKDLRKIRTGPSPTRAPNAGWWVKIGYFRPITRYNSKTLQGSRIVYIKVEYDALYRMVLLLMTLSDP